MKKVCCKKYKQYWIDRGYSENDAILKSYEYHSGHIEYWLKRGFTKDEAEKKIREQTASNIEYWLLQEYSVEDAKEYALIYGSCKSYKGKVYSFKHLEYWLAMGYSKKVAIEKIKFYLAKNKKQSAYWIALGYSEEDAKKKIHENNPTCKQYWLNRGYSEKDATIELKKLNEKFPEYWIAHGFSKDAAKQKAAEISDASNVMSKIHWLTLGYSEKDAEQKAKEETSRISNAMHDKWDRSFNRFTKEFWMAKGYSEEDAIEQARFVNAENTKNISKEKRSEATKKGRAKISKRKLYKLGRQHSKRLKMIDCSHSPCFKGFWIKQGYSEEDAKTQAYLTRMSGRRESGNLASKIEIKFFDELSKYLNITIVRQKWVTIGKKVYCQDGRYNNIVFEFNGTRFHLDSRFYSEKDCDPFGRTYQEVHDKDIEKEKAYFQKQYNVIIIWEYDYLNYKKEVFSNIERIIHNVSKSKISGSYWSSSSLFNKC